MAEPDNSNVGLVTTIAIGGCLCVVAIVAAVEGLYWRHDRITDYEKNVKLENKQRVELKKAQTAKLEQIKIDEAMSAIAKEAAAKQAK
jgi:hypothetical protein